MGIDASRVKMAIKHQLESSGVRVVTLHPHLPPLTFTLTSHPPTFTLPQVAFESAEHLITAAFGVQREQERRSRWVLVLWCSSSSYYYSSFSSTSSSLPGWRTCTPRARC